MNCRRVNQMHNRLFLNYNIFFIITFGFVGLFLNHKGPYRTLRHTAVPAVESAGIDLHKCRQLFHLRTD